MTTAALRAARKGRGPGTRHHRAGASKEVVGGEPGFGGSAQQKKEAWHGQTKGTGCWAGWDRLQDSGTLPTGEGMLAKRFLVLGPEGSA